MKKFLRNPHSALIVSTITCTFVGIAIFVFGAPPIVLLPAILVTGTIHAELKGRVTHRFDGPRG